MGKVKPYDQVYKKPFTNENCLYAIWEIETISEDGDWETVSNGNIGSPFLLDNNTGSILIDTTEKISDWKFESNREDFDVDKDRIKEFERKHNIDLDSSKVRYTQKCIEEGDEIYVIGEVKEKDDIDSSADLTKTKERLKIGKDTDSGKFIISNKTEKVLSKSFKKRAIIYFVSAIFLTISGLYYTLLF